MEKNDDVKNSIFMLFSTIIVSCISCMDDLPIYLAKDYNFKRYGVYPYTSADEK